MLLFPESNELIFYTVFYDSGAWWVYTDSRWRLYLLKVSPWHIAANL